MEKGERVKLVEEYRVSGQSLKDFALERSINYSTMRSRVEKTEEEELASSGVASNPAESVRAIKFQEFKFSSEVLALKAAYSVRLLSGRSLSIPREFQAKELEQLVRILERC